MFQLWNYKIELTWELYISSSACSLFMISHMTFWLISWNSPSSQDLNGWLFKPITGLWPHFLMFKSNKRGQLLHILPLAFPKVYEKAKFLKSLISLMNPCYSKCIVTHSLAKPKISKIKNLKVELLLSANSLSIHKRRDADNFNGLDAGDVAKIIILLHDCLLAFFVFFFTIWWHALDVSFSRSYYKCSSMRGCTARKHVERCLEDPSMLVVTYEGDHNHSRITFQAPNVMIH